jgi:hypothetical protein
LFTVDVTCAIIYSCTFPQKSLFCTQKITFDEGIYSMLAGGHESLIGPKDVFRYHICSMWLDVKHILVDDVNTQEWRQSMAKRVQNHIGDDDGYSYCIKHIYTDDFKPKSDVI